MTKSKKIRWEPKKKHKLKNVFASMRSRLIHEPKPVTLPEIKALTLEEIEKKYGNI